MYAMMDFNHHSSRTFARSPPPVVDASQSRLNGSEHHGVEYGTIKASGKRKTKAAGKGGVPTTTSLCILVITFVHILITLLLPTTSNFYPISATNFKNAQAVYALRYGEDGSQQTYDAAADVETSITTTTTTRGRHLLESLHHYEIHDMTENHANMRRRSLSNEGNNWGSDKFLDYEFEAFGRKLSLELERDDDLFGPNYKHVLVHSDGTSTGESVYETVQAPTDCFYRVRHRDSVQTSPTQKQEQGTGSKKRSAGRISLCEPGIRGHVKVSTSSLKKGDNGDDNGDDNGEETLRSHHAVMQKDSGRNLEQQWGNSNLRSTAATSSSNQKAMNNDIHSSNVADEDGFDIIHIEPIDAHGQRHAVYRRRDLKESSQPSASGAGCGVTPEFKEHQKQRENEKKKKKTEEQVHKDRRRLFSEPQQLRNEDEDGNYAQPSQPSQPSRRLAGDDYILKVTIVNDQKRYSQWGIPVHSHSAQLVSAMAELYDDFPEPDTFDVQLVGMYTFTNKDGWDTDSTLSSSDEANAEDLLNVFDSWASSNNLWSEDSAAAVHLLTGHPFQGDTLGLAYLKTACSSSASGITTAPITTFDHSITVTMTHEVGHNLGIDHTNEQSPQTSSTCTSTSNSFIMDASLSSQTAHDEWTSCCKEWFDEFSSGSLSGIVSGAGTGCMSSSSSEFSPSCGDGIVQGDEECDCPLNNCNEIDDCCDGSTCKLKSGSECSEQDTCCSSDCKVVTDTNTVCRPALEDDCDTAETCDGTNPQCPPDEFEDAGTSCTTDGFDGKCFLKVCVSRERQCGGGGDASGCTSCEVLECGATCEAQDVMPRTGIKCGGGKGCYDGECIAFSEIPLPGALNCTNGVADGLETDVDCGGAECFSCQPGEQCLEDSDCVNPSECNKTEEALEAGWNTENLNGTLYGRCSELPGECVCSPCCPDWLEDILGFLRDNLTIVAPIAGGLILLIFLYCCWPSEPEVKHSGGSRSSNRNGRASDGPAVWDASKRSSTQQRQSAQNYDHNRIETYPEAEFVG